MTSLRTFLLAVTLLIFGACILTSDRGDAKALFGLSQSRVSPAIALTPAFY